MESEQIAKIIIIILIIFTILFTLYLVIGYYGGHYKCVNNSCKYYYWNWNYDKLDACLKKCYPPEISDLPKES
tara:strand:+ start:574 stop:792 length:219 start_codon:yes stop_codon:yes gene_type:complete